MATKELKYPFAFDEKGNVVSANDIDELLKQGKLNAGKQYFISWEDNGVSKTKRLDLVKSKSKRKHFREHRETAEISREGNTITVNKYNETIIHKLAKQLLMNRDVSEIYIPKTEINFEMGRLCSQREKYVYLLDKLVQSEVQTDDGKYRFDIVIKDSKGEDLIVEIKVTHGTDWEKIKYLRDNRINAIEIDMTDIYEEMNIIGYDIVEKVKSRLIGIGDKKVEWLSHKDIEEIKESVSGIIKLPMYDTRYKQERDGNWYVCANDAKVKGKLKMCPHYSKLSNEQSKIYERDCRKCSRLLSVNTDKNYIACYHSTYEISKLLDLLYSIDT